MKTITQKHVTAMSDYLKTLVEGNASDIIEAFGESSEPENGTREVKLSLSAKLKEMALGKYELKTSISFSKAKVTEKETNLIDDRQLGIPGV